MTIFLDISKYFLAQELGKERERARRANHSYFGKLRDTQLSEFKREQARQLRVAILTLPDSASDNDTLQELRKLIEKCKESVACECKEKNFQEGEFGRALIAAIALVDEIYRVLGRRELLDIKLELNANIEPNYHLMSSVRYAKPLDRFYYYSAFYICQKSLTNAAGLWDRCADHVLWASTEVGEAKVKIILAALNTCKDNLDELDNNKERYHISCANRVLEFIDKVLRENAKLCSDHAKLKDVPLRISLPFSMISFSPSLKPGRGELRIAMEHAQREINELKLELEEKLNHAPASVNALRAQIN